MSESNCAAPVEKPSSSASPATTTPSRTSSGPAWTRRGRREPCAGSAAPDRDRVELVEEERADPGGLAVEAQVGPAGEGLLEPEPQLELGGRLNGRSRRFGCADLIGSCCTPT